MSANTNWRDDESEPGLVPLLEVDRLSLSYGKADVLRDVSLRVGTGDIVTVIGPNGAGKTSLLNAIMGAIPSRGSIRFDGKTHSHTTSIDQLVNRGLTLVSETRALFTSMSVEDNLRLGAFRFRHESSREKKDALDDVLALFPRLNERRRQMASTLSGGERQMLALGRALMSRPRLLMLDEPSLGLAPLVVREIFQVFSELRRRGVSLLLIEQNARAVMDIADRGYVLELGQITIEGATASLAHDPRIIEAYLGLLTPQVDQ